jgi:drug/metabolite transporter (DMT)-like permease
MTQTQRGALYGISAAAIWGGMYVVSDLVLEVIPPFTLLSMRLMLGWLVLYFFLRRQPAMPSLIGRQRAPLLGVGMVGFGVSIGAQFVGTDLSTAVNGSLITSASPAFIVIFAVLLLKEKLSALRLLAIGLASLGVLLIINPTEAEFSSATFQGDLILAVAALTWGLYSVLVRWASAQFDTLRVTLYAFMGGMMLAFPLGLWESSRIPWGEVTPLVLLGILYLGLVSTAGAMWLWNRAFALVPASLASLFFFAQPFVGAGLGVLALGQPFTLRIALGGVLILVGVFLSLGRGAEAAQEV